MPGRGTITGPPTTDESSESESFTDYYSPHDNSGEYFAGDDYLGSGYFSPNRTRHPPAQMKDKDWKFVWPRDQNPRHGRWGRWDRIKDLATGHGPDIWIEELHRNGPHHPVWTGWKTPGYQNLDDLRPRWTNVGFDFRQDYEWISPIKAARREDGKRYNHRTRRYRTSRPGMWSDVVWSNTKGSGPLYFRNEIGEEWVNPSEDGGAFNNGQGPNPFYRCLP